MLVPLFAAQLELTLLWEQKVEGTAYALAFSDGGNLGVASDACAYVFSPNGTLLSEACDFPPLDVSYCCNLFGFTGSLYGEGYVYITDESGSLIKKFTINSTYASTITLTQDGFIVCFDRCAFFDFNGTMEWEVSIGATFNGPSHYQNYWYVSDWYERALHVIKDGERVNELKYSEWVYDTAVCDKYLAVGTDEHLYLYELSDPTNPVGILSRGGMLVAYQVAFSPDCKYIAVVDSANHKLKIFDTKGSLVYEKYYGINDTDEVFSVAWGNNTIAVGLIDGRIYVYEVEEVTESPSTVTSPASWGTEERALPVTALAIMVLIAGRALVRVSR